MLEALNGRLAAPVRIDRFVRPILLLLAAAALAAELLHCPEAALVRNLCVLAGAAVIAFTFRRGTPVDLPFPRARWAAPLASGVCAVAVGWRTLSLPYFADDWQLLDLRGRPPDLWQAFSIPQGEPWFRPLGWATWWFYHRLSPLDGGLAHGVNVALFAGCAALVGPALRRMGVPRGVAAAAGILFAFAPASLETIAWATNNYSLLAVGFSLASLATLPVRRAGPRRWIAPGVFAALAFLSKEDSFLLPLVALATAARFRPRFLLQGVARTWPLFLVLAAVVALRHFLLGGMGAYRDPGTGESVFLRRLIYGPRLALELEFPSNYLLPSRWPPHTGWLRALWLAIPSLLLLWGAGRAARRSAPAAAAIVLAGLAPVAPLLPIGPGLEQTRWLFFPTVGICAFAAALLAGGPLNVPLRGARRKFLAWIPIVVFAAVSAVTGERNYSSWRESASVIEGGLRATAPRVAELPKGARAWIVGVPWMVRGAYCANCGVPFLFQRWNDRYDMEFLDPVAAEGRLDAAIQYKRKTGLAVSLLSPSDAITLEAGQSWNAQFTSDAARRAAASEVEFVDLYLNPQERVLHVRAGLPGTILLPAMHVGPGSRYKVTIDASGLPSSYLLRCTAFTPHGIVRVNKPAGAEFEIPAGAELLRFDVTVPFGEELWLRSIRIERAG